MSEDRWTYPTDDADPGGQDQELVDPERAAATAADRAVTHPQEAERSQGTTADAPGVDPADRETEGGQPTFE